MTFAHGGCGDHFQDQWAKKKITIWLQPEEGRSGNQKILILAALYTPLATGQGGEEWAQVKLR